MSTFLFLLAQFASPARAEGPHLLAQVHGSGTSVFEFGFSSALDGSVAVFGAPSESGVERGAIYLFEEQLDGTWHEVFRMPAPRDTPSFGYDVAIEGDRVLAGSIGDHAHLIERVAGVWTHTQVLSPSDGDRGYGHAVAMSGDTVVIGALSRGGGVGGAYVLERDPTTGVFQETQILVPAAATPGAAYGGDVAIDGDTLAMAGDWADEVVVFERDPTSGLFVETETLTPSDGSTGAAVAIDGDRLVIGDMWFAEWDGAAWVFDRDPVTGAWVETQRLDDPFPPGGGNFGWNVRVEGDLVAVGAKSIYGTEGGGSVVVFRLGPTGWDATAKVYPPDPETDANFGVGLGLSDERLTVGARLQPPQNMGTGYVFELVPTEVVVHSPAPGDWRFDASGFTPHGPVRAFAGSVAGEGVVPLGACTGTPLGLVDPRPWRSGLADPWGLGRYRTTGTPVTSHVVVLVDETTCSATAPVPIP